MINNKASLDIYSEGLIPTHNNIDNKIKIATVSILNKVVIELTVLSLITKQVHWNIRGSNFISIHKMLDDFFSKIIYHQDVLAERIVQLGGIALGLIQKITKDSELLEIYSINNFTVQNSLKTLSQCYGIVANLFRKYISEIKDVNTTDMLLSTSCDLDNFLWLIEANIE